MGENGVYFEQVTPFEMKEKWMGQRGDYFKAHYTLSGETVLPR